MRIKEWSLKVWGLKNKWLRNEICNEKKNIYRRIEVYNHIIVLLLNVAKY